MQKKHRKKLKQLSSFFDFLCFEETQSCFKTSEEYVIAIITIFILKSFSITLLQNNELIFDRSIKKLKSFNSYSVLNYVNQSLITLIQWVSIKDLFELKAQPQNHFPLIMSFVGILINDNFIKPIKMNHLSIDKIKSDTMWIPQIDLKFIPKWPDIHFTPYKYVEKNKTYYAYNNHFSTMIPIYTPNKHSNEVFKLGDSSFLDNIYQMGFWIDYERLLIIFNKKLDVNHIKEEELYNNYNVLTNELKEAIKENNDSVFEISKKISIYGDLIKIEKILKFVKINKNKFFVPSIFDFRGRMYQKSDISLTFVPEMRYCIYTTEMEKNISFENEFKKKIKSTLSQYLNISEKLNNSQILNLSDDEKEQILWILIYAAETEKTALGDKVTLEKFLETGVFLFNNWNTIKNTLDYEKFLQISHAYFIINEIFNKSRKYWFIKKDCTASVYQILIKALGYKDEEFLKYCNFCSEFVWYDTYIYIIKWFRGQIDLKFLTDEEFNKIFSRSAIKHPVMTENYGVSRSTFLSYFYEKVDVSDLSYEKQVEVEKLIILFFNVLKKNEDFFSKSSKEIIDFIKKENYVIQLIDRSSINFIYKKRTSQQMEVSVDKLRLTKKFQIVSEEINNKKINTSTRANYAHALDAVLMRELLLWAHQHAIPIFGIHDCWMVPHNQTTALVAAINEKINLTYHDIKFDHFFISNSSQKFYSLFIVL